MNSSTQTGIVNFLWNIADDVLRDVYPRGKYRDTILPMTVLRRLDCLLEPTKDKVLERYQWLNEQKIIEQKDFLCKTTGYVFYNTSKFTMKSLLDYPSQTRENFEAYLDGFSANVQEIIEKFELRNQLKRLTETNTLYPLIVKFVSRDINLSPKPVVLENGIVKHEGLTNLGMGAVFEELIRRFSEENNEEAGEHFTPREIIELMANLIFLPIKDKIQSTTYLVYDDACGTGGMLTEAERVLQGLAAESNKKVRLELYGQEVNPETFAICQSDMLIKERDPGNIKFGSTLSKDGFPRMEFDFMLANPPYGKSWKMDEAHIRDKDGIIDPRFKGIGVPRSSDGQLLFLVNMLSKMKETTELGSRVATVHNGSALFTGDAGQGESDIRKWIIENDWLECIISLPKNMFYNTEMATYILVLSNRKPPHRQGKVQLIDASEWYSKLRKNLGKKTAYFAADQLQRIIDTYMEFKQDDHSRILDNEDLGYSRIVVERPLRLAVHFSEERIASFRTFAPPLAHSLVSTFLTLFGSSVHKDYNVFQTKWNDYLKANRVKLGKNIQDLIREVFVYKDESAEPVVKNRRVDGSLQYEPDTELRDSENVPLKRNIADYFEREIKPYTQDAWIDHDKTVRGYEVRFSKVFFRVKNLRNRKSIEADIENVDKNIRMLGMQLNQMQQHVYHQLKQSEKRESGIAWIGEVPEHWEVHKAKRIFGELSVRGYTDAPLLSASQELGVVPRSMLETNVVMPAEDVTQYKLVEPGQFVISLRSFQGGIEHSDYRGIVSPAYIVLSEKIRIDKPYFKHLFKTKSFVAELNTAVSGVRQGQNIIYKDFAEIYLPIPPFEEQHMISDMLDISKSLMSLQQQRAQLLSEDRDAASNMEVFSRFV